MYLIRKKKEKEKEKRKKNYRTLCLQITVR